jgi:hypothetical protein
MSGSSSSSDGGSDDGSYYGSEPGSATHDGGDGSAFGSDGSDDELDLTQLSADEYVRDVGAIAMIDSAYAAVQHAQPFASELVDVLTRALESWEPADDDHTQLAQQQAQPGETSLDLSALLESPTTPSGVMAGLDPESLFLVGVEGALVDAVRDLVAERPFRDEAPHFLANHVRIHTARLEVPPDAEYEDEDDAEAVEGLSGDEQQRVASARLDLEPEPEPQDGGDPLASLRCATHTLCSELADLLSHHPPIRVLRRGCMSVLVCWAAPHSG